MSTEEDHAIIADHDNAMPKGFGKTLPQPTPKPTSRDVLVELALKKAIAPELQQRFVDGSLRAAVIDVPEGGWADPIGDAIEAMMDDNAYVVSRSAVPKPRDINDHFLLTRIQEGRAVVGVAAQSERALPPLLLSVSELTVTVAPPDADLVIDVIRRCQPEALPDNIGQLKTDMLSFDEITSIIDGRTPAARTFERLQGAIERKVGVVAPRAKAKVLPRLEDAIEYGEAREWAMSLRDDISDLRKNLIGWEDIDRGCILEGPPGSGKTLLAQMLGEACGVSVVVSSLGEMFARSSGYLNDMVKEMRAVFDEAKAKAPCILFLDEINALPNIDKLSDRNSDYWTPLILDFYQLLDGATSDRDGVIVIGATNRIQDIHPALLRPGRLERSIHVGPPDAAGIERIMRHHLGDDLAGVDLTTMAALDAARHATGAVVMEQVRAARRAARRASRVMVIADLETQVIGEDRRTEGDLHRAAVHEAGHLIAGRSTGGTVDSISIIASSNSSGSVRMSLPVSSLVTRPQFEGLVISLLGGRAAEQLLLGEPSQGAGGDETSDLAKATAMVASMEASLGLGDSLLFRSTPDHAMLLLRDPEFRRRVEKVLRDLYQRTIDLLHEQRPALMAVVEALLEKRFMTGAEVAEVIERRESMPPNIDRVEHKTIDLSANDHQTEQAGEDLGAAGCRTSGDEIQLSH